MTIPKEVVKASKMFLSTLNLISTQNPTLVYNQIDKYRKVANTLKGRGLMSEQEKDVLNEFLNIIKADEEEVKK